MPNSQSDNLAFLDAFRQSGRRGKISLVISSWFGFGLSPFAPGTCGSIATVPLILLMWHLGGPARFLLITLVTIIAVWTSGKAQEALKRKDPREVVIDEVAGYLLAVSFVESSWTLLGAGFLFFRFFDILKPFPIRRLEKLKGGTGIVADDLMAGAYSAVCLKLLAFYV